MQRIHHHAFHGTKASWSARKRRFVSANTGRFASVWKFMSGCNFSAWQHLTVKGVALGFRGCQGIEERYNPESGAMIRQVHWSSNQKVGEQKIWNSSGDVLLTDLIWDGGRAESGFEKSGEHENIYKDGR